MASTVTELLRRRMMGASSSATDLTGFTLDKGLSSGNYEVNADGLAVSPFYDVEAGDVVGFKLHNGDWLPNNKAIFCIYSANGNSTLQRTIIPTTGERLTAPANTHYCRFAIRIADADDCYAYNETKGAYLWKGKNV